MESQEARENEQEYSKYLQFKQEIITHNIYYQVPQIYFSSNARLYLLL